MALMSVLSCVTSYELKVLFIKFSNLNSVQSKTMICSSAYCFEGFGIVYAKREDLIREVQ